MRNSDSARKMLHIDILDDFVGVNLDVLGVNLHFCWCALVGINFFSGVEGEIWILGWWKKGRTVFGEFWDIGARQKDAL